MGIRTLALMVRERGLLPLRGAARDGLVWLARAVGWERRPAGRTRASTIDAMHARAAAAIWQLFRWYHP
jgi:hypothetical protein